ncbi:MAG: tRNA pseudouridine38-40 synthase [Luteibaculaceae bacterium]|jgi:tRNA pseudouridine38-40 synthase
MKTRRRFFLFLDYAGTHFCGYQIQPNGRTVQEEIEKALQKLCGTKVPIVGCGRTDAGVHAKNFVAHFDLEELPLAEDKLVYKLNRMMPQDIYIHRIEEVSVDLHARFSATARTYQYDLSTRKNPFKKEFVAVEKRPLNFEAMNLAAKHVLLMEDFTSFCKLHSDNKTNLCDVTAAHWFPVDDDVWRFEITANRFLRNMVRAIVGSLLEVGLGKWSQEDFIRICKVMDRNQAGTSAPGSGLHLVKIQYPTRNI